MGFWFFKKKRETIVPEYLGSLEALNSNLKTSFFKIKTDIQITQEWLSYFKDKEFFQDNKMRELEDRIDELGEVIAYMQQTVESAPQQATRALPDKTEKHQPVTEERKEIEIPKVNVFDHLTETQKKLFLTLSKVLHETGQEWVPLKALADDSYGGKPYDDIRSTVSEYLTILLDFNLVKKQRKGKQAYVSLTERGKEVSKSIREQVEVLERGVKKQKKKAGP